MQPTYLKSLTKGRQKLPVCVRVVRKWTIRERMGQGKALYIGLVVADAQGDAMYAEIPQEAIQQLDSQINVNNIYVINRFKVLAAKPSYRPFNAQIMIELSEFTAIRTAQNPPDTFPLYVYNLTPLDKITPTEGPVHTYTDVLGYITKYTAAAAVVARGQERGSILREIFIKDMRDYEIKVTLWGNQAVNFRLDHLNSAEHPNVVVALFVGCLPKKWHSIDTENKSYVSGGSACHYYLNPAIKEAQPFYERFKDDPIYIERPSPSEEQILAEPDIVPLKQKTIAELDSINPYDFEDGTYKCTVTVAEIMGNNSWWYMACKACKKKTEPQPGGGYICPKCHGTLAIPRYLLSFTAKDETGDASFFAFDDIAKQIVLKECELILNPLRLPIGLPQPLQAVIGKKFIFSVDLTEDSYTSRAKRQYLVQSILDRSDRRSSALNAVASTAQALPALTPMILGEGSSSSVQTVQATAAETQTMLIVAATPTTPAPVADLDNTPVKDTTTRSPTNAAPARKRLFSESTPSEKEHTDEYHSEEQEELTNEGPGKRTRLEEMSAKKKRPL